MNTNNNFKDIIMHIDVNSAFLSWEAVKQLKNGSKLDIRKVPSVIGGDDNFDMKYNRKGIIVAKSIPAKKFNIKTGETLYSAFQKCPSLLRFKADFSLYQEYSKKMIKLIEKYIPKVDQYSIDECFAYLDGCDLIYKNPIDFANFLRNQIKEELGFTVNIGISTNRLLAKMASDFKKPNMTHTLFHNEIKQKMWNLDVSNLFMVGKATLAKLYTLNIRTIGDLAKFDKKILRHILKSHADTIIDYANGIESKAIIKDDNNKIKSIGNSITLPANLTNSTDAHMILLALIETSALRLRKKKLFANSISVGIKNSNFKYYSHQLKLEESTCSTNVIYNVAIKIFEEMWKKDKIRLLSVSLFNLTKTKKNSKINTNQISIIDIINFETPDKNYYPEVKHLLNEKTMTNNAREKSEKKDISNENIDYTIDKIKEKYGKEFIKKATLYNSSTKYELDKQRQKFPLTMPKFEDDIDYYS